VVIWCRHCYNLYKGFLRSSWNFLWEGVGWDGRLFEAGRLLTFSAFRMGAYSRWALIRGWALIRINTVFTSSRALVWSPVHRHPWTAFNSFSSVFLRPVCVTGVGNPWAVFRPQFSHWGCYDGSAMRHSRALAPWLGGPLSLVWGLMAGFRCCASHGGVISI